MSESLQDFRQEFIDIGTFIGEHANNGPKGKYANGTVTTSHARHLPHSNIGNIESMYTMYSITIEQTIRNATQRNATQHNTAQHSTAQHSTTQQEQNNLTEAINE